jgi:hypothetical protein
VGYFRILGAVPGFFLSSLFFMLLWDPISARLHLPDVGYVTSMLIVITLWIAVAPLATAGSRMRRRKSGIIK